MINVFSDDETYQSPPAYNVKHEIRMNQSRNAMEYHKML